MRITKESMCLEFTASQHFIQQFRNKTTITSSSTGFINNSVEVKTVEKERRFKASAINQLAIETCTKSSTLIKQPNLSFQIHFYAAFYEKIYHASSDEQNSVTDGAFINLKMKRIIALEDLDEKNTEIKYTQAVEIVELNGSGRVYDLSVGLSIDLNKDMTKGGSTYVALPIKYLSVLNIENKSDDLCGNWYITAHRHPTKVNLCRTNSYRKYFNTLLTNGLNLDKGLMVKDSPKFEKLKNLKKMLLK